MSAPARPGYRALLSTPGGARSSAAALVGRMPIAMLGIGSVLLVADRRGSYALAGAAAGAYAVGRAAFGPFVSRLVDKRGQARVLPVALALHAVALLALVGLSSTGAPGAVLLLTAAGTGATLPPLGPCIRTRWGLLLAEYGRSEQLGRALALESVVDEVVFVLGPVLVVALAAATDPALGMLASLALAVVGTLAFVGAHADPPRADRPSSRAASALRVPGVRVLALTLAAVGVVFGALEVVVVVFAEERGAPGAAGWLLALVAAGSGGAGLVYGARSWRMPVAARFVLALAGLVVGVAPLLLAPGIATLAPLALLSGIAISPTLIASYALVEVLVPPSAHTEGYSLLSSGLLTGVAAGSALGGALADSEGARSGFAVCLAAALVALAVAATGRRTLST